METKKCSRCKLIKQTIEFNKSNTKHDGFRCECRSCQSLQTIKDSEARRHKLNEKRFTQIYSGLSEAAKKVYRCIPPEQDSNVSDIALEMKKIGLSHDRRHILGVLDNLKNSGLLTEPQEGCFKKITIKKSNQPNSEKNSQKGEDQMNLIEKLVPESMLIKPKSEEKPIEKIGLLVKSAQKIMMDLQQLCEDIESVAIEVEQMFENNSKDAMKLKQLQTILKSIGN